MSSWADMSEDHNDDYHHNEEPVRESEAPRQRKKLQLKPRSAKAGSLTASSSGSAKSNPFGAAKPREEVLASKGIDAKAVDARIQKKAQVLHFTREQETELEGVRAELSKAEAELRNANEHELPEEKYRVLVEEKRHELNELMAKFSKENTEKRRGSEKGERPKYERPSERRKRLDEEARNNDHHHNRDDDDVFASFGGRRRSSGGRRGEGGNNYS